MFAAEHSMYEINPYGMKQRDVGKKQGYRKEQQEFVLLARDSLDLASLLFMMVV